MGERCGGWVGFGDTTSCTDIGWYSCPRQVCRSWLSALPGRWLFYPSVRHGYEWLPGCGGGWTAEAGVRGTEVRLELKIVITLWMGGGMVEWGLGLIFWVDMNGWLKLSNCNIALGVIDGRLLLFFGELGDSEYAEWGGSCFDSCYERCGLSWVADASIGCFVYYRRRHDDQAWFGMTSIMLMQPMQQEMEWISYNSEGHRHRRASSTFRDIEVETWDVTMQRVANSPPTDLHGTWVTKL